MKTLPLIFLLFATFAVSGQTAEEALKAAKAKHVTAKYDKFKDTTVVSTKPYSLMGTGEGVAAIMASQSMNGRSSNPGFTMQLGYVAKGDSLARPDTLFLMISSRGSDWKYLKGDQTLYFLVDGTRMPIEQSGKDNNVNRAGVLTSTSVTESLFYVVTPDQIRQLIAGKEIEMKLGAKERKVKHEIFEWMDELLRVSEGK